MNFDYVLLVHSGLLSMMAIGAAALARIQPRIPWVSLALYALVAVLHAWINLALVDLGSNQALHVAQHIVLAAEAILLIEIALGSRESHHWRQSVRALIYGGLGAIVGLAAWFFGERGFDWSVWGTTTAAAAWAASRFARSGRQLHPKLGGTAFTAFSYLLTLHAVASAAPDRVDVFPALNLSPHWWRWAAVVSGSVLAVAVYIYNARAQHRRLPRATARAWRRRRYLCAAAIWLVVIAGWFVAERTANARDASMRAQIRVRTMLAAAATDVDLVRDLAWNETDLARESYRKLKALMISLRRANSDLRFALLAGLKGKQSYFLVDSEPPDSADYSPPGQLYAEADPAYLHGMAEGKGFELGPIADRWGTWVLASTPLLVLPDGRSVHLELDVAAVNWAAEIRTARLPVLLITLLISVMILGFFQAQERLRETAWLMSLSEQRSRSLVEGSPDCVQMFDAQGRFEAVNANGLKALGLTGGDVLGRQFWEIWPAGSQPAIRDAVRKTLAGAATSFEAEYRRPDGARVTWRVATNPVRDAAGRVCNFVGICVDLTERKNAEEAMRAAKESAEEATRAKSEFLAVMSHELRTPLAGVIGMLDLLRRSPPENVRRQYTAVARDSAETLLRILDDILDTAKIEAGRLTLEAIPFRPRHEFRHLCEAARLRAETKGLDFEYDVAASVPEVLVGDPIRLRQIVGNLQNNALKFTETGRVAVRIRARAADNANVRLTISVSDTGIGIPEKNRARLFAKFEQGDFSTTRRYGGTGLGLSIVKALADAMNGTITVESQSGVGSTFEFAACFAVGSPADVPEKADAEPAEPPVAAQKLRILCAEDDTVNRMVAEALITHMGHVVDFAVDGQLAIERLCHERYDLVLMDNRMPVMDGFQTTALIRSGTAGVMDPDIYICAATANVSEANRQKCRESGMNDYVEKPLLVRSLCEALQRAVASLADRGVRPVFAGLAPTRHQQPRGLTEAELLASIEEESSSVRHPDDRSKAVAGLQSIFWRQAPDRIAALRAGFAAGDVAALGETAHALKSAARYVGAHQLATLAAEIDELAGRGELTAIGDVLIAAEAEFDRIRPNTTVAAPA